MPIDDPYVERAVTRLLRIMAAIGTGGALGLLAFKGWPWAAGFALGSVVSWVNFRWLKQIVDALGGKRPRGRLAFLLGLRYLLLGGGAYAILRYSRISLHATLAGLFVSVAAVIIEILFQLVYARD